MKTQHKATYKPRYIHTPMNAGEWGTKDVIATSTSPGVPPTAVFLVIHQGASPVQTRPSRRESRGCPSPRWPGPCNALWSPFLPSSPHKICARAVPSLSLPSPNSCFSETQKTIWTQHPDTLMSQLCFPNCFESSLAPLKTKTGSSRRKGERDTGMRLA